MIYLTEGNIPLSAAYDDDIVQEANSTYQLTFKFPTNNILWQRLREETFLTADDLHGEQDFVIFEVEKKHGYIQVYANQVMTMLNHYVVNPMSLDRVTGPTALSHFAGSITRSNPFSFFSDIEDRHTFNIDSKNAMEALTKDKHSIVGLWGGDLVRHGYQVRLLKNGGSENESLFMYKKNLSSYEHKTSTKSLRTRITFMTTIRGEGENPVDKHYKVVVDSPLINKYSQIYEDVVEVNDQDVVDEATLLKYGKQYFRTTLCDMLEDSIEIDVIGQSDVPVQMFDVVGVFHEYYDLDVRKKITKYNYSPMAKKLKSIGFGEFKSGLASAIGNVVSDAVKNETQHLDGIFEAKLAKEIKNADLAFDRKVEEIKNQFEDEVNAAKAKAEENKRALSDEIDRRFHEFSPAGFDEAKTKAEEALKKAGTSADLVEQVKGLVDTTKQNLDNFKNEAYTHFLTEERLNNQLSSTQTELKKYVKEETKEQTSAIRETISRDYVAKSTFTENVEGIRQRFEALKRDNETKLAEYKQGIDGRFANLSSQIAGKANDVDFQRVKETSQLYERTFGSSESDISRNASRLVMSDQRFQTEVGKYVTDDNNLIVNSMTMNKHTLIGNSNPKANISVNNGIFTIKAQGLTGYNWSGFSLPIYVKKIYKDETYTLGFKYRIREYPDSSFAFNVKNHGLNKILLSSDIGKNRPPLNEWQEFQKTFTMQEDFAFGEDANYPFYIYLAKNGWVEFKEPILVRGSRTGTYKPSQFDDAYRQTKEAKELAENAQARAIQVAESAEEAKRAAEETRIQVTQKLAEYKETSDGRFAKISSQIDGKADQSDFQRVKETSQLYERILGTTEQGVADNASRLVMSSQIFQTEVKKITGSNYNLVFDPTNFSKWEKKQPDADVVEVSSNTKLLRITNTGKTNSVYHGFRLPLNTSTFTEGEKLSYRMEVWVDVLPDAPLGIEIWAEDTGITSDRVYFTKTGIQIITGTMTVKKSSTKGKEFPLEIWLMKNGQVAIGKVSLIRGETPPNEFKDDTSAQDVVTQTKVTQLSDSYAIQTLTNAGAIASQINTNANNILIEANKIRLKGRTLADEITAIDGYFKRLFVGDAQIGTLNTDIIRSNSIAADKLIFDTALAKKLVASDVFTDTLAAKTAFINKLRSVVVSATLLEGYKGKIGGFQIGTHEKDPTTFWLTGSNSFRVGMSDGGWRINQTCLWVNWGNDWGKPGDNAWYVTNTGEMYCKNSAAFHKVVAFSSNSTVNFYGTNTFYTDINMTNKEIYGNGWSPRQGNKNAVVWWNQVGDGTVKYWGDKASDRRLKENIVPATINALDIINKLDMVEFDFIKDKKHEEVGLIAQEVEKVIPQAISKNPENEDDFLHIDYTVFVPYLIKAIQELNQKVERLKTT